MSQEPIQRGSDAGTPAEWNRLTGAVIGCAIEVHRELGPGLLERLYEEAMVRELRAAGVPFERQVPLRVEYKGHRLSEQKVDLLVAGGLIVELKCVERVADVHLAQFGSYLRSFRLPLGLLINFNVRMLKEGIFRRINSSAISATSAFKDA